MKQPITLVLLGDIAAGKGTQAQFLVKRYHLKLVDLGAYSRKVLVGNSKISKRLERVKLGKLAPSDIIQNYLRSQITNLKKKQGLLIDGGKMPAEAKLIYNLLKKQSAQPLVIYLSISRSEILRRLAFRFYDKKTGRPLVINPKKVKDGRYKGKEVIKRADDDPKAIKRRLDYYEKIYSKTVRFWQSKGLLKKIKGKQSVGKVSKDITKTIQERYS